MNSASYSLNRQRRSAFIKQYAHTLLGMALLCAVPALADALSKALLPY